MELTYDRKAFMIKFNKMFVHFLPVAINVFKPPFLKLLI